MHTYIHTYTSLYLKYNAGEFLAAVATMMRILTECSGTEMVEVQNYLRAKAKVCQPEQAAQFLGGRVGGQLVDGMFGWWIGMQQSTSQQGHLTGIENLMIRQVRCPC